jgi:hypothetical protein
VNYSSRQSAAIGPVTATAGIDRHQPHNTCLLSNKCLGLKGGDIGSDKTLTSTQKRSAEALRLEFELLTDAHGLEPLLFITPTFPDPLPGPGRHEAIYEKYRKYFLHKHFRFGLTVFDRSESGRPHYHIIAVGAKAADYRNGFDFEAWHASRVAEKKWNASGHTDQAAKQMCREMTAKYTASASPELRAVWTLLDEESSRFGFGRVNAVPIENPEAAGKYLASCVTTGFRLKHPEDRKPRRVRYWGKFPRKVTLPFYRVTKNSTHWRGKLAFCGHVLGFTEFGDFPACFGRFWFIHLKGIIQLVPTPIAEASLLTSNLPNALLARFRRQVNRVETELLGRLDRYGNQPQPTK